MHLKLGQAESRIVRMGDDLRRSSAHVDAAGGRGAAGRRVATRAGLDDSFEGDGDNEDGGVVWGKRAPLESPTMSSTPAASYRGFGGGGGGKVAEGGSRGEALLLLHDTNQVGVDEVAVVDVLSYLMRKVAFLIWLLCITVIMCETVAALCGCLHQQVVPS